MEPGKLQHRLTIQRLITTTDQHGDRRSKKTPLNIDTVWGSVNALKGNELLEAQQIKASVTHEMRFRYDSTLSEITVNDQIAFDGRTFQIAFLDNFSERNEFFTATVEERS